MKMGDKICICTEKWDFQGGRGHWAVFCTSSQSFLIRWLDIFGDFCLILICWFIEFIVGLLSVQTFQPLILIYWKGNFVYHHWGLYQFNGHCHIPLDPCGFHNFVAAALVMICSEKELHFKEKKDYYICYK